MAATLCWEASCAVTSAGAHCNGEGPRVGGGQACSWKSFSPSQVVTRARKDSIVFAGASAKSKKPTISRPDTKHLCVQGRRPSTRSAAAQDDASLTTDAAETEAGSGSKEKGEDRSGEAESKTEQVEGGEEKKVTSEEDIGNAIRALREENMAKDPASATDFWQGVAEETRLIEWPSFQKVLGTTGVVVAMILGSSVLLLTVNAILSQLSDNIFKNT